MNPSGLPLGATANLKKFKASMLDIGLMQRLCQVPAKTELLQEDLLARHSSELFYWARGAEKGDNFVNAKQLVPILHEQPSAGLFR